LLIIKVSDWHHGHRIAAGMNFMVGLHPLCWSVQRPSIFEQLHGGAVCLSVVYRNVTLAAQVQDCSFTNNTISVRDGGNGGALSISCPNSIMVRLLWRQHSPPWELRSHDDYVFNKQAPCSIHGGIVINGSRFVNNSGSGNLKCSVKRLVSFIRRNLMICHASFFMVDVHLQISSPNMVQ
jgi:hypothetical protein